jgi:hypothetical protein
VEPQETVGHRIRRRHNGTVGSQELLVTKPFPSSPKMITHKGEGTLSSIVPEKGNFTSIFSTWSGLQSK